MVERVGRGGGKGLSQSSAVLIPSVNDWRTFRGRESAAAVTGFSLTVVEHGDGEGGGGVVDAGLGLDVAGGFRCWLLHSPFS